ncbi:MAG: Rpn family recombination-promoting nuclease/putative transposase [Treponema sp.]|nr:Rpn family recombination-promoting nuclease/putative transposase [Treponema sp.]
MANLKNNFITEDADLLPPSDDRIFKALLTHPNAKQVLIDIISAVIEQKVLDVQIRNNELPAMDIEEKIERFDVNCTIENGDQVNVEMHCEERVETGTIRINFLNKYTYYLTDLHSSQKSKGVRYKDLKRTYQITFSLHTVFSNRKDFVHRFSLRTEDGEQLTDQVNIIIVELSKLYTVEKKPVEALTTFEKWSLFFKYADDPVYRKLINDIIKEKEEIGMAATLLREISQDEHERARIRSRKMYEMDKYSDYHTAVEIGLIKGRKEGITKTSINIARNALAKGMTPEFVRDITGLSLEEIAKL